MSSFNFFKTFVYTVQASMYVTLAIYYTLGAFAPCSPILTVLNEFATKQIFYCVNSQPANAITQFMVGGAHPLSWVMLFTFASIVRFSIPVGNNYYQLFANSLVVFLICAFIVGLNEFIWDGTFLSFAFSNTTGIPLAQKIFYTMETFLTLGAPLALTGVLIGIKFKFYNYFNTTIFLWVISIMLTIMAIWVYYGFHVTAEYSYHNDFTTNLFESIGHWTVFPLGASIAFLVKRFRH